ncbi:MAG: hypothetical protein WAV23_01255 [Minisyncoccia bacterium]
MYNKIIKIISLIIGVEAILVMFGWIFGFDLLTRFFPKQGINMAFTTALMFFLSVIGIFFLNKITTENEFTISPIILSGITLIIFLINITILISSFIGVQSGLENLFVRQQDLLVLNDIVAGLPSLPTILCFIFLGFANIFSLLKYRKNIKFFGYAIFIISFIALMGYILKTPVLYYKFSPYAIPMAFNTSLSFVLLSICVVLISENKKIYEA